MPICPVCDTTIPEADFIAFDSGGPICEIHEACPKGHYSYSFAYGSHQLLVGGEEIPWGHESREKTALQYEMYRQAVEKQRKLWAEKATDASNAT